MMSTVDICQKTLCWLPDVKRLHGCILKVSRVLDLIWVDIGKSVDPAHKKIRSRLCAREYKTTRQDNIPRALLAYQVFSAVTLLEAVKVLVSIMMSVGWSNKGEPLKLRHYDISRAHFQGTAQRLIYIKLPGEDCQKYGEDKVGRLVKSMYGAHDASHFWQLDYVNLICGELGGFRRGKQNAALFHNPNQDVGVHGDDFVCLSDDDAFNTTIVFSNPNTQRKTWEQLD